MDRQKDEFIDGWTYGWMNGQMDRQEEDQIHRWMDKWMDGMMDIKKVEFIDE